MSQHDYDIANAAGAVVRADVNSVLAAIITNNSGATAPSTTYANMWWFDTSTNILKQRDNSNTSWVNVGKKDGSGWTPYRQGTLLGDVSVLTKDTDGALAANSDSKVATQKATKTYADTKISKSTSGELNALTEKTDPVDDDLILIEDSENSYSKKKVKRSSLGSVQVVTFTNTGSPHSWVVPTNVNSFTILGAVAPGGGGGGGRTTGSPNYGGGGGSAGASVKSHILKVVPGETLTITIPAGGLGGATQNNGSNASDLTIVGSSSGTLLTLPGGLGGIAATTGAPGTGANGADGNIDDAGITSIKTTLGLNASNSVRTSSAPEPIIYPGGDGGDCNDDGQRDGGPGGNSLFGQGGDGGDYGTAGAAQVGQGPGAGGGGGRHSGAGAAGADALLEIAFSVDE